MIWTIARREFLEYLKSLRFLIGFLITVALMTLSTVININDYTTRLADYSSARVEMAGDSYRVIVYRPPEALSTLAQGLDRSLGNQAAFTPQGIPLVTSGYIGETQGHRFVAGFTTVDCSFVVRIVLSLIVIFLAYNAVAGEKASGTLRLVLSHQVPRYALLVGKSVGGLALVLTSMAAAMTVTLLVLILHPAIALAGSDWMRIAGMVAVSALYVTTIFALSIAVSVLVERPSTSLLILLQAWVFLVVIYPALAIALAGHLSPLPTDEELSERKKGAFLPYEKELHEVEKAFHDSLVATSAVPPAIDLRSHDLHVKQASLNHQVDLELARAQDGQLRLAEALSILSPAALYDQVMVRLARTGPEEFDRFMQGVWRYWEEHAGVMRIHTTNPETKKTVLLSEFRPLRETDQESFAATAPQCAVLLILTAIFFMGAHAMFSRKDVR